MRLSALLLACSVSVGCAGAKAPTPSDLGTAAPEGESTPPAPASQPTAASSTAAAPSDEVPTMVQCSGKVLSAREAPVNKAKPALGGHWILEMELAEWSSEGASRPEGTVRIIVPKSVIETVIPRPKAGEQVDVDAILIDGKPNTIEADSLRRAGS